MWWKLWFSCPCKHDDSVDDNENDYGSIIGDNKTDGDVFYVNDNYDKIVITKMKMVMNDRKLTKIMKIITQ